MRLRIVRASEDDRTSSSPCGYGRKKLILLQDQEQGREKQLQEHRPKQRGSILQQTKQIMVREKKCAPLMMMSPLSLGQGVIGGAASASGGEADRSGSSFERKGQAWFVATELQSDLVVEVDDLKFHLHKFPLLSRSGKLNRLVFETRDSEKAQIKLLGLPGGPEAFELAAKFCYGMPIDLTAGNVAALRCAAEFLEMVEELEEGNLISKTEAFLSFVVLASWKDSITVLISCEDLMPWAENLQIVRRCSESIAWKACTDPNGVGLNWQSSKSAEETGKGWPILKSKDIYKHVPLDWWFEDVLKLCTDSFVKVINAMKVKGMRPDLVGAAISKYAYKWMPALNQTQELVDGNRFEISRTVIHRNAPAGNDDFTLMQNRSRLLLESIVSILPPHKIAVSCSFLLQLLRVACMQNASPACRSELEKRIGTQLDQASLTDLLIPSFAHNTQTLHDVDLVQRIVDYFILQETTSPGSPAVLQASEESDGPVAVHNSNEKIKVAKLLDSYLAEIARDANLPLPKFQALAETLPEHSRASHDGLYRAIDTYLKVHPGLNEHERKRLCRVMNCQKLSPDACLHASQNERLPLRTVVQVLFSEQLKLKNSLGCKERDISVCGSLPPSLPREEEWESARSEIRVLKTDVQKMKDQFLEIKNNQCAIQRQLEKLSHHKDNSLWSLGLRKLGKLNVLYLFNPKGGSSSESDTPRFARRWKGPK